MKTKKNIVVISDKEQLRLISELRDRTNMGMLYCKYALKNSDWNLDNAQLYLKESAWKWL